MGTKYSSQSISGYNSTPPPDDGSVSEANKVKWSTIKNKLTDPPKVLAEAVNTAINTALDYGPISVVSAAVTLGASHNNQFIEMSGASVPTLATANGLGAGWFCDVKNTGAETVTISRALASDMINDVTADVVMGPLDYIRFVVNAAASGFQTVDVKRATAAQVTAGTASDVFVTPENLASSKYSNINKDVFVNHASGYPSISGLSGSLDVDSTVSSVTWKSIGPPGSGADHTWSDLDAVPTDVTWVELRALSQSSESSGTPNNAVSTYLLARKNGGAATAYYDTVVADLRCFVNSGGYAASSFCNDFKVPVSSRKFDIHWQSSFSTANITLYLVGYGYNSV